MNKVLILAACLSAAAFGGPVSICDSLGAANLVQNCGFETGDLTGWTTGGNFEASGITRIVNSGTYAVLLGPVGSDGTLSQTLNTIAGVTYDVTWYLASDGGNPNDFSTTWNGNTLFSQTDLPPSGYTQYEYTATGTGSDILQFAFRDDPGDLGLDDVSVVAEATAPEPSSAVLVLSVLALGFGLRRKFARVS